MDSDVGMVWKSMGEVVVNGSRVLMWVMEGDSWVDGEVDVYGIMSWYRGGREMMGVGERVE